MSVQSNWVDKRHDTQDTAPKELKNVRKHIFRVLKRPKNHGLKRRGLFEVIDKFFNQKTLDRKPGSEVENLLHRQIRFLLLFWSKLHEEKFGFPKHKFNSACNNRVLRLKNHFRALGYKLERFHAQNIFKNAAEQEKDSSQRALSSKKGCYK